MKAATVYRRGGCIVVHSSSRTTSGFWIAAPPFLRLEETDSQPLALGDAIMAALTGSNSPVPPPLSWRGLLKPLLEQACVKSWETFVKNAHSVEVLFENNQFTIIPNRNLGPSEGFEPIDEKSVIVPVGISTTELGIKVSEVLAESK
jgi:hypothetical protein